MIYGYVFMHAMQTAQEYEAQYERERGDSYSQFHGYAYDAIWTAAATIKSVVHKLREQNKMQGSGGRSSSSQQQQRAAGNSRSGQQPQHWSLHDFVYRDSNWEKFFLDALRSVNFTGVTVRWHQPVCVSRVQLPNRITDFLLLITSTSIYIETYG